MSEVARATSPDEGVVLDVAPAIASLITKMHYHDPGTYRHLLGVGNVAGAIAQRLGCAPGVQEAVRVAALLHDIGKLQISPRILNASRDLTAAEWEAVRRHPASGAVFAHCLGERELARVIRAHHERLDGYGYPDGLRGTEIPLASRIISVADTYDVLTRGRPYRAPRSPFDAFDIIVEVQGKQFDPEAVGALLELPLELLVA